MRRIAKTLLVTAFMAAVVAPTASAQIPPLLDDPVGTVKSAPSLLRDTIEQVQVEPPQLPLPDVEVPDLPPLLPEDTLPDVPQPTPVPLPLPPPAPAPEPSVPDPPAAAGGSPAPAAAAGAESPRSASGAPPAPAAGGGRAAPRARSAPAARTETRAAATRPRERDAAGRRDSGRSTGAAAEPTVATRPAAARVAAPAAATAPAAADPPSMPERVADEVADFVRALPAWIVWALVVVGLIALVLAVNAVWQWRRRTALEKQRAELLDDIGVLSRALLPPVPGELDGLAVSAAYRPADGPAAGGDFYDVFVIGERRVCVLVGDVSGHGRESVTQAALARYTLRTLLAAGHPPGEALARADALLQRELQPNFVTVIAGVYDPATGELTYAKAGHAPPIVIGADHDPDGEQPAPPLALGLGEAWPEFRVQLNEGVSVCLFTDGLEDARLGDARVGRDAVERLLAAQETPEAGRLLCDLEELANLMCDDTAAIVLSRR